MLAGVSRDTPRLASLTTPPYSNSVRPGLTVEEDRNLLGKCEWRSGGAVFRISLTCCSIALVCRLIVMRVQAAAAVPHRPTITKPQVARPTSSTHQGNSWRHPFAPRG